MVCCAKMSSPPSLVSTRTRSPKKAWVSQALSKACLQIPAVVIIAWWMGRDLSMDFGSFQSTCFQLVTIVVVIVASEGKSYWLKGVMLLVCYIVLGAAYWFHGKQVTWTDHGVDG